MGTQLTVAVFAVTIVLMLVRPSVQMRAKADIGYVNEGRQIHENLRSLFDSIAKNDMENTDAYRNILEGEAVKEQQTFDTVKREFRFNRPKKADIQKDYVYGRVSAVKRDINTASSFRPAIAANFRHLFDAVTSNDLVSVKRLTTEEGLAAKTTDHNGKTAAHVAAETGQVNILDYLLSLDPSLLSARDKVGQNILYVAMVKGKLEIVRYLVDNCHVDVLHKDNIRNGNTAVHVAVREGHMHILKYFLDEKHIDPEVLNDKGESPAFTAAGNKKLPILVYLVTKHGVNLQLLDSQNRNILFPAAIKGDITVLQYVLDQLKVKLDINWADNSSRTVLHWTALSNLLRITQYIVEQKRAEVNKPDQKKQTPLHLAAQAGHIKLVEYLYSMGADPRLTDEFDKRPIDLAKDKTVIRFLSEFPNPR